MLLDHLPQALSLEPTLAEAYFNRGLCYVRSNQASEGVTDLSKAGELGLYEAYSILKSLKKG